MNAVIDASRRLTLSRVYKAPPELVWKVWTDPAHISQWWGPFGPGATTSHIEPQLGGLFCVVMTAPDGSEHPSRGIITALDPPHKLVIEGALDAPDACGAGLPPGAVVTVTFLAEGEGTRLTLDAVFPSQSHLAAASASGYLTSWNVTLDALIPYLERHGAIL